MRPLARFTPRTVAMLAVTVVLGMAAFCWPLAYTVTAMPSWLPPVLILLCVPLSVAVVAADLANNSLDVKGLALLGVLSAVDAALRPLGAGTAGFETVFALLILGGAVFGPGFGFVLGVTSMFASALLTAGVGGWLPYQMLAAGFVGLGAGLIPIGRRSAPAIAVMSAYGALSAFAYGSLMDFSTWPYVLGTGSELSFDPALSIPANLHRFAIYETTTAFGWNLGRAISTVVLLVLLGRPLLHVLRRAARRSGFIPAEFAELTPSR